MKDVRAASIHADATDAAADATDAADAHSRSPAAAGAGAGAMLPPLRRVPVF